MQIEAGKYYRLRDGKKAFVSHVMAENPFNKECNSHPIVGFIEGEGADNWTENGGYYDEIEVHDRDIVAEWREPSPWHRPFKSRDEFWAFRNEWFKHKQDCYDIRADSIRDDGVGFPDGNFVIWVKLFNDYTFSNGDCCGVRNT